MWGLGRLGLPRYFLFPPARRLRRRAGGKERFLEGLRPSKPPTCVRPIGLSAHASAQGFAYVQQMVKAMDEEQLIEEISHHETLLKIQRRNLRALELQIAQHGPFDVPLHMRGAQDDLRAEVVRLDRALRDLRMRLRRLKSKR